MDLSGTVQPMQSVAANKSGLAFTEGDFADEMRIAAQNPGAPVLTSFGASEQLNPVALFFLQSSGIKKPSDLIGKTIGVPSGRLSQQDLTAFLRTEGIPQGRVTIGNTSFFAQGAVLLSKKIDAIAKFVRGLGSPSILGKQCVEQIRTFAFAKYDIASPPAGVVVQKSLVDKRMAIAKAIAQTSTEALYFCVTNEEKCIKDFIAATSGFLYTDSLDKWQVAVKDRYGLNTATVAKMKPLQLGWISPAPAAKIVPELQTVFDIRKQFNPRPYTRISIWKARARDSRVGSAAKNSVAGELAYGRDR